jgi:uncharacterized membrane protein YtjA (UPF0391 family)
VERREADMLGWAVALAVVVLLTSLLGVTGISGAAALVPQILFVLFLALFVGSLLAAWRAHR